MLSASCSGCSLEERKSDGCEVSDFPVWSDPLNEDEYHACPFKFIPRECWDWVSKYEYILEYPGTAEKYEQVGAKYLDAELYYRAIHSYFKTIANGGSVPESAGYL